MKRLTRKLWAAMRLHEHNQERRQLQPPPGEVFLTDVDGALLVDADGSYLTEKE
jgi:hypothetical protein